MSWDSTVIRFNSLVNVVTGVDGFNASSFGTPPDLQEGNLTSSFFDAYAAGLLTDGTVLFTLRFDVVGEMCDESLVSFNSGGIYSDDSFETLDLTTVDGNVMIEGADCGGGMGADNLTTTAAMLDAQEGTTVCVPISVEMFNAIVAGAGMGSGQGDINWDPTVLEFIGIENNSLPAQFSQNASQTDMGTFKFVWFNFNVGSTFTLPDDAVLFEICFNVIGEVGDMTAIDLEDWEWADDTDDNNDIPDTEVDGKVTIVGQPVEVFQISMSEETVDMGEEVCLDVSVSNFDNVIGLEHRITWDASVLSFGSVADDIRDRNLEGLLSSNFFHTSGTNFITLSWSTGNPPNSADGTVIYKVCFDAIGDCDTSSDVEIAPNGGPSIIVSVVEGGTSSNLPESRISIDNGRVDIVCVPVCDIVSIMGSCAGENGGSVTVSGTTGGSCVWTNSSGTQVSMDCNLLGVPPGEYDLAVTYPSGDICNKEATVPTLDAPVIMGTVTNAGCGQGQITATVTFPSGSGTFSWSPDLGQVLDPLVDAGQYTLTATDNGGCSASEVFVVQDVVMALGLSPTSTNVSCNGAADGTITTNPSGGCPPYSFAWNGGLTGQNPTMVGPGIYTVTMTDSQGSTIEGSGITITQPDAIIETSAATIIGSNGADGAITVNIMGGTGNLTYAWSPGALPNSNAITGLAPGMYTLVVTDENGCTTNFGPYEVPMNPDTLMDKLELTTSTVSYTHLTLPTTPYV